MRIVILLILIYSSYVYADEQDMNLQEIPQQDSSANNQNNTNEDQNKITKVENFFNTAKVSNDSYSAFMVGYEMMSKKANNIKDEKQGMYFELDRGFLFNNIMLFGFSLDGTAGGFYAININTKFGLRIFDGRIIPNISFGYGILNHAIDDKQYNLHGLISTISLFLDIGSGFGVEAGYRVGLNTFKTTQKTNIKVKDIGALMLNFKYINF